MCFHDKVSLVGCWEITFLFADLCHSIMETIDMLLLDTDTGSQAFKHVVTGAKEPVYLVILIPELFLFVICDSC